MQLVITLATVGTVLGGLTMVGPFIGWRIMRKRAHEPLEAMEEYHTAEHPTLFPPVHDLNLFDTDPLGSWVVPDTLEDCQWATELFDDMVARGQLTGVGVDCDTTWQPWDLVMA